MKIKCVNYLSVVLFLQLSTAMIVKNIQSFYFAFVLSHDLSCNCQKFAFV